MRAVLLIAHNFIREQRWLTLVLVLYAVGGALVFGVGQKSVAAEDLIFFLNQQAIYSVLFSLFLGASAIQNERKSRRIVAVLSKAITRRQYLAGLLAGVASVFVIYCAAIGAAGSWLMRRSLWPSRGMWLMLGCTALASLLTTAVTLFYSTFLTPLFATAATGLTLGIPMALERAVGPGWGRLIPVYALVMRTQASLASYGSPIWDLMLIAAVQVVLLWIAATWIFRRRDVTVAVE